jgi:DNA-binding phage protein
VSRSTYKQMETTANPQLSTLVGLAEAVGMNPRAIAPELFTRRRHNS